MTIDIGRPKSFEQILERLWWKLDVALDEASLRAAAEVALLDALECGVTTVIDHHESPSFIDGSLDVLAECARRIGVRLVACYGSTDRHGRAGASAGLRENERFAKAVANDPLVHAMVGLHAGFTVSDETLAAHVELARALGAGLHIHAAEDRIDLGVGGRLERASALGPKTLLAHGVHLTDPERVSVASSGATVVHNPRSNMQNAVGYADVARLGVRVALGTDGMDGDLFTEVRTAHLAARAAYGPQGGIDAVAMLGEGNALAERLAGAIETDAVALDYDPPTPIDATNAGDHLLFGIGARHVRAVTIAGEAVLEDGKPTRVDGAELRAKAREEAKRLWGRMV
jgi:cytosine/adenosine deaminase-related metal-dependent hydrolase